MSCGLNEEAALPPTPDRELPGHFVSEDLQSDCARFLDELRARIMLRRQPPPHRTAWVAGRPNDVASMGVIPEEADKAAAQSPPNSRAPHAQQ